MIWTVHFVDRIVVCPGMECVLRIQPRGCGAKVKPVVAISSLAHNAGASCARFRNACNVGQLRCGSGFMTVEIRGAASKQKKKPKVKVKKRSPADVKQWKFDELMLVWDEVFLKACEDNIVASKLFDLSRNGWSRYGRGCVLVEDTVITRPWGAASGFTFKSRYSSSDYPELPMYSSVEWKAKYVPKHFLLDPSKAPEVSDTSDALAIDDVVQLVDRGTLNAVLRGMDKTRLLGLLADPTIDDLSDPEARDVGGEEPCDHDQNELVVMLVVSVDGQQACGADVLKAFPTVEDGVNGNATGIWTFKLRDELPL